MKILIIHICFLFCVLINIPYLHAQTECETGKELNYNIDISETECLRARDKITFEKGFKWTRNTNDPLHSFSAKLNEHMVLDVDYITTPINIDDYEIDKTLPVGATAGVFNVSPTGAATYTIPIEVPPGTNGMQPSIAVTYNSQSGNGLLGWGWHLSGLSVISRNNKAIYFDGIVSQFNLAYDDALQIDGNRLVIKSGNYGLVGSVYTTEEEMFDKITIEESNVYGPIRFKVEKKNGLILEYGGTLDSRYSFNKDGVYVPIMWMINKVTDRNGNYMQYIYDNDNGEVVLKEIVYTGNNNEELLPYNSISFFYERRKDINTLKQHGYDVISSKILTKIILKVDNKQTSKFIFEYTSSLMDQFSFLQKATQFGKSNNDKINSTLINWDNNLLPEVATINFNGNISNSHYYFGDFNGDGLVDYLKVPKSNTPTTKDNWELYFNNGGNYTNNYDYTGTFDIGLPGMFDFIKSNEKDYSASFISSDFNGDGLDDLLIIKRGVQDLYGNSIGRMAVFYSQIDEQGNFSFSEPSNLIIDLTLPNIIKLGDFNGDGITDIYFSFENDETSYFLVGNKNDVFFVKTINWEKNYLVDIIDFNGDGKSDILFRKSTHSSKKCFIFEINENPNGSWVFNQLFQSINSEISLLLNLSPYFADFNGDGKTDFLIKGGNGEVLLFYSTGKTFQAINTDFAFSPAIASYYFGDFNGDGKTDIIQLIFSLSDQNLIHIKISYPIDFSNNTQNFLCVKDDIGINLMLLNYPSYSPIILKDINGDGKLNIVGKWTYFPIGEKNMRQYVKSIENGLGNRTSIEYKPLSDNTIYTRTYFNDYPLVEQTIPLYVVSSVTNPIAHNNTITTNYSYTGLRLHKHGKGILGFKEIEVSNNMNYISQKSVYSFKWFGNFAGYDYLFYQPLLCETYILDNNNIISTSIYSHKLHITNMLPRKSVFFYHDNIKNINSLNGTLTNTSYIYNTSDIWNGNVSKIISEFDANNFNIQEFSYNAAGWFIPYKVSEHSQEFFRNNENNSSVKTRKQFLYNSNGNIEFVIAYNTDNFPITNREFNYDNFGNLIENKLTSSSGMSKTNYLYDTRGRFNTKVVNSLNQTIVEYGFNEIAAKPKWSKDINGNKNEFFYDGFGRLTETISPTGKRLFSSLSFVSHPDFSDVLYSLKNFGDSLPETIEYYNNLGQKIHSTLTGFANQVYKKDYEYDEQGRLFKTSMPYITNGTQIYNQVLYDDYNRIVAETNPVKNIVYEYNGLQLIKTNTNTGQFSSQLYDAAGLLIEASDNGGSILYSYEPDGIIKTISSNGVIVSIEYDENRRQKKLIDPNAGIITYFYDDIGLLREQTDANGNYTELQYDALGRITSKLMSNDNESNNYTYTYDTETNGEGLISEISYPGYVQKFKYNKHRQITEKTETIENNISEQSEVITLTTKFSYNGLGNISEITYPSGFKIKNEYDNNSYLYKVKRKDNEEILWQMQETNNFGQITKYLSGNGKQTTMLFDTYGMPERYTTPGVMDLGFLFNHYTGNLSHRTDYNRNLTEVFEYDNLNRLTDYEKQLQGQYNNNFSKTITYSNNGNIESKTGIGSYIYDHSSKPHALTGVENIYEEISEFTQEIFYNSSNKAYKLIEDNYTLLYQYGADQERRISVLKENDITVKTKYYDQNYEKIITPQGTQEIHYIHSGSGLSAIYVKQGTQGIMYYTYTDYLGSIISITDAAGNVVEERSYDPWGRQRNPADWTYTYTAGSITDRGYTGHEMLPEFGLINMNGRMYDPALGRMLSPDNYVQSPNFTQSFNRYSYCYNNPLVYVDPDGDIIFTAAALLIPGAQFLLPIAIGTDLGWMTGGMRAVKQGETFWYGAWRGATVGAVGGALSMVGGGTFVANLAWGAGQGAFTGGLDAMLWGEDVGRGMLIGAGTGAAFATITSGVEAFRNHRDGFMFRTNEGNLRYYFKNEQHDNLFNFLNHRYGIDANIVHCTTLDDFNLNNPTRYKSATADFQNNTIRLSKESFSDLNQLKLDVVHEYAHLKLDFSPSGGFRVGSDFLYDAVDGPSGYLNEVANVGNLKINHKSIAQWQWDAYYQKGGSLFNALPNRYNYKVRLYDFW